MKISIIVLNWNGSEFISDCLASLQKLSHPQFEVEMVVVDNDSTDSSPDLIRGKFPGIKLIQNDSNLGFAEGNNVGIRYCLQRGSDFVWLVNPDMVAHPSALLELVRSAGRHISGGVFGSKTYFAPGFETHKERYSPKDLGHVLYYAGGHMDWANLMAGHRGVDEVDTGQYDHDVETDFVNGASMFIRSLVLNAAGLLDPRYFLYYEENDFCQRVKRRGWQLIYASQSILWHSNARSTGLGSPLQDYYITRNRLLFGMRYAPVRTKLALARQSMDLYFKGRPWERRAVLDYYTGNLGAGSYQP